MYRKDFLKRVNKLIEYLKSQLTWQKWTRANELLGCFLDIKEDLELPEIDWDHINYKLFAYFKKEWLFAGNPTSDGDVYVSEVDKANGAIQYYLDKAIDYCYKINLKEEFEC